MLVRGYWDLRSDKDVSKRLLQVAKIPVVPWITAQRAEWERDPKGIRTAIEKKFKYPVFVKPATLGSSVGMTKVEKADQLAAAYQAAAMLEPNVFAEPWITGGEYTVAVLQG